MSAVCSIKTAYDDEGGIGITPKFFKFTNGVIDAEFGYLKVGLRISDFVNDAIELSRPRAVPNIGGC